MEELYKEALAIVLENQKASISFLQKKLMVNYLIAETLINMLEERGIIGSYNGAKPREILQANK